MRSVAKGNYIRGQGAIKHAMSHIRYLELRSGRDKEELEGRRRTFISATCDGISGAQVRERIKQLDENKIVIHRIVLSPGIDGVDMTAYTRYVMSELENTKGRELEYYSTDHKNTEHDHAHLVILGSDENGKEIRLNRAQYRAIREASDRYLERHHEHTRYLDKDLYNLMRDGYVRDRGDDLFEGLLSDLRSEYTIEECEGQKKDQFVRLLQLKPLPKEEKIVSENVIYTKHSSLLDLQNLVENLNSGSHPRLSKEQYSSLQSWIRQKEKFGDDYYERTAQTEMLQRIFDENLRHADGANNCPPRSFRQYIFESRGRMLDWHERYTVSMQRDQLEKEIRLLKDDDGDDLKRAQLLDHIEWLNELSQERNHKKEQIEELKPLVPAHTNNLSNTERALENHVLLDAEPVDGISISEQMFVAHVENAFRTERNLSGPQEPLRPDYVEPEPTERALPGNKEPARETIGELLFGDASNTPDFLQNIEKFEIGLKLTRVDDSARFAQEMNVADNLEQRQQTHLDQNSLSSPGYDTQYLDQQKDIERRRLDDDVGREHCR